MIMPSLLTWVVGAAVLAVASLLLRFLADEAQKLARAQGRASVALRPKGGSTYRNAAQQKGVACCLRGHGQASAPCHLPSHAVYVHRRIARSRNSCATRSINGR
jgi:hypothetical protein